MIRYIKQKIFYAAIKRQIFELFENWNLVADFSKRLFESCKDMNGEELKNKFIHELAGFAHEQAVKEREKENAKNENAFAEK